MHPDDLLAVIAVGAAAVAVWPCLLALRGSGPLNVVPLLAHVSGMLAGYGVVVLIGLMSRTPSVERGVGADRLARWHSRGGRIVVMLTIVHAWAAIAAWAQARREGPWLALWHVLRMPWLISAFLGTVVLLVVAAMSIRMARRRVSFETWHSAHLLVYIAVSLGFVHQLAGPDLAGYRVLQICWAMLYAHVFALVLRHRVVTPLRNASRHRMQVTAVVPEGPGVVSIHIAGRNLHELQAESGQFFRWRFLTPDLWKTAYPFSLSAPPTSSHLRLTVKALGDGSRVVQDKLETGTWVLAEGPYGAMTAHVRSRRNVVLIAGGVGITPMRALFETIPVDPGQDLLLLYRARTEADILFRRELERLSQRPGVRVRYLIGNEYGRFSAELFQSLVPDIRDRDVYLCGPARMASAVREAMRKAGVAAENFHEESFGP